jgi:hypothetical protein
MRFRRGALAALLMIWAASAGAAITQLVTASDGAASASTLYRLRLGDHLAIPAIGWECSLDLVQGTAAFGCNPGKSGTKSQGDPIVSAQWKRLVVVGGPRPKLESLATPKAPIRIWTFAVVRH